MIFSRIMDDEASDIGYLRSILNIHALDIMLEPANVIIARRHFGMQRSMEVAYKLTARCMAKEKFP
jgi:hypothetical protein